MNLIDAIVLGAIQGLTEFLPISSSGHLVIVSSFLEFRKTLTFDIAVHFASLLAILLFFRSEISSAISELKVRPFHKTLLARIALGTVPAVIVGLFFSENIEAAFKNQVLSASMLYVTAFLLFAAETLNRLKRNRKEEFSFSDALIIGAFQALAVVPGISRSGSTISAGILTGHTRESSARFSFLLAMPAIAGAMLYDLIKSGAREILTLPVLAGFLSSFAFSYIALAFLFAALRRYSLYPFAVYCVVAASTYLFFR